MNYKKTDKILTTLIIQPVSKLDNNMPHSRNIIQVIEQCFNLMHRHLLDR